ncbi:hypothetical protein Leryth_019022, partial [Lithospermum erythrorhizon]
VAAKKQTLKNVTDYIVDVICKLSGLGYNYGVQQLIAELNEILAHDVVDEAGVWKKKLTPQCLELLNCYLQRFRNNCCLREIHMETFNRGNRQGPTMMNLWGNPTYLV